MDDPIDYDSYSRIFDQVESESKEQCKPSESNALSDYAEFLQNKILKKKLHN